MLTSYTNPVFDQYMADPFVLKHKGNYYAYGTAPLSPEGYAFPVLHSTDLVNWQHGGWSLIPPGGNEFWAPEVAHHDGIFYMYYSAHGIDGKDHQLRVATSKNPLGPFQDAGVVLLLAMALRDEYVAIARDGDTCRQPNSGSRPTATRRPRCVPSPRTRTSTRRWCSTSLGPRRSCSASRCG